MSSSTISPSRIRSLYRSILRELPNRPLSTPSPIQRRIRSHFSLSSHPSVSSSSSSSSSSPASHPEQMPERLEEAEQFFEYAKAQRVYAMLVERYNSGMSMSEEERVRLTMRRVGMDLPVEWDGSK